MSVLLQQPRQQREKFLKYLSSSRKIFHSTFCVEKSPERSNLAYYIQYVDNNLEFGEVFESIITEIKNNREQTTKTLIYSQTRKQAAVIWRAFKLALGDSMYCGR